MMLRRVPLRLVLAFGHVVHSMTLHRASVKQIHNYLNLFVIFIELETVYKTNWVTLFSESMAFGDHQYRTIRSGILFGNEFGSGRQSTFPRRCNQYDEQTMDERFANGCCWFLECTKCMATVVEFRTKSVARRLINCWLCSCLGTLKIHQSLFYCSIKWSFEAAKID